MTFPIPENSVFISVGSGLTADQEEFVAAIESVLYTQGLRPITLGRNIQSNGSPLEAVHTVVSAAVGALVIAFARWRIMSAVEFPRSATPLLIAPRNLPSVWNQIEAAMAYQAGKPLLIFIEQGVHPEGIIDPAVHPCLVFRLPSERGELPAELQLVLSRWIASLHAKR